MRRNGLRRTIGGLVLLLAGARLAPAQVTLQTRPEVLTGQDARRARIGDGDLLQVTVFDEPQLSASVRVSSEGTISLPLTGVVKVGGMTPDAAAATVSNLLQSRKLLLHPQVSILITEYVTAGVSVEGEVKKPGLYTLLGDHTLLDALSAAGGLTPQAGAKILIKRRAMDGSMKIVSLALDDAEQTMKNDVPVFANDLIVVPRAGIVYVLGDVSRPGGYTMRSDGRLTLMQAISQAEGTKKTASLSKVRVLHRKPDGTVSTSVLHLSKIEEGKREDVELAANDVVFVPNSTLKSAAVTLAGLGGAVATAVIYTSR